MWTVEIGMNESIGFVLSTTRFSVNASVRLSLETQMKPEPSSVFAWIILWYYRSRLLLANTLGLALNKRYGWRVFKFRTSPYIFPTHSSLTNLKSPEHCKRSTRQPQCSHFCIVVEDVVGPVEEQKFPAVVSSGSRVAFLEVPDDTSSI